jgi:putative tributyrin esterase
MSPADRVDERMRFPKMNSAKALWALTMLVASACGRRSEQEPSDRPLLAPRVAMQDVTFHSAALGREMPYRIITPGNIPSGTRLPVVYLLHGGGGSFRDWSNFSDVARFAKRGLILVMPEADESYYTNSVEQPQDRYEDYIVNDLIKDVEARFPAAPGRANRAIVGISMGGFGAVKLALHHPDLFAFAGGLSSAIDVPTRTFSITRIGQYRHHRSIFGPWGSATRRDNDPFVLARSADTAKVPYFYLTCGEQEGLLPSNRSFASLLVQRQFRFEFHIVPGGHNWTQWNARLDDTFSSLLDHLGTR